MRTSALRGLVRPNVDPLFSMSAIAYNLMPILEAARARRWAARMHNLLSLADEVIE